MSKLSENTAKITQILADIEQLPEDRYEIGKEEGRAEGRAEGETIGYENALAKRTDLVADVNGTYEPQGESTGFKSVQVAVPERVPILQEKTATENGEIVADEGYDGLSKVTVNVGGVNKLVQMVDGSITELTEEDLQGATKINDYAFRGFTSLTSIDIPKSVTEIGERAFYSCTNLDTITIPESVVRIGMYAFYSCNNLSIITIPKSVKKIAQNTFMYCTKLATVIFAEDSELTEIDLSAFQQCTSLTSIEIPKSVTKVSSSAFSGCSQLKSVVCKPTTPPTIQSNTFNSVPSDCIFTVPFGSGNAYRTATNWSARADYIVEGDV